MGKTLRMGIINRPGSAGAHPVATAEWAEAHGYESIWLPDGGGRMDSLTLAAAMAMKTATLRLCMGIVPVYTRPPAIFATSALTLAALAPGRVVLGLGSSHPDMVQGWYGVPFEHTLARMRETTQVLRRMLDGERVDFDGETLHTHGFQLATPLAARMPLYISALRPRMLELAGELADGVILNLTPLAALPRMLEHIDAGAKRAGRRVEDLEVVSFFNAFVTDDPPAAAAQFRKTAAYYYAMPAYNGFLAWCGHRRAATELREALAAGERKRAMAAVTDELAQELALIGTAAQVKTSLDKFAAVGLDTAAIGSGWPDPVQGLPTLQALAPGGA